jgi:hypothetical protein
MPFLNRIRLPMQLHSAQFPEERTVFRKANGVTKTLSVVIRKQYEVETDYLPERWHQRLTIALAHDNITWEGDHFLGGVSKDGDYNIQWPDGVLHYPTAKAECKVQVTPFDATNSNCQTCEEASQLDLVDDQMGTIEEDTDYTASLADNDTICCFPAVFSLISYNSDYLTSATINASTGVLSIHTGTDLISANGLLIATYRVTCPNGGYDEANVYADVEGTIEGCLAPTDLTIESFGASGFTYSWVAPFVGASFYYELYEGALPVGSPLQSGDIGTLETVTITGLPPDADYYFQVRTVCYGSNSNFIGIEGHTTPETEVCGEYEILFDSGTGIPQDRLRFEYMNCAGATVFGIVFNNSSMIFCAAQTAPGVPINITPEDPPPGSVDINYLGLC